MPDMGGRGRYRTEHTDLLQKVKDLETRLSVLERAPKIGNTSLDQGAFRVKTASGAVAVTLGLIEESPLLYGLKLQDQQESTAVIIGVDENGDDPVMIFQDGDGNRLFGVGSLGVHAPVGHIVPVMAADWTTPPVTYTSGTFVDTWIIPSIVQGFGMWAIGIRATSPSGTTAEIRFWDHIAGAELTMINLATGEPVGGGNVLSVGSAADLTVFRGVDLTEYGNTEVSGPDYPQTVRVSVQARRLTGSGTPRVGVFSIFGQIHHTVE